MRKIANYLFASILALFSVIFVAGCDKDKLKDITLDLSDVETHVSYFEQFDYTNIKGYFVYKDSKTPLTNNDVESISTIDYLTAGAQKVTLTFKNKATKEIDIDVTTYDLYLDTNNVTKSYLPDDNIELETIKSNYAQHDGSHAGRGL